MSGRNSFKKLTQDFSEDRRNNIEKKKAMLREEMELSEIRQAIGRSQEELAKILNVMQPAIAKLEKRSDIRISSLRSLIEALGGTLELKAHFPQGEVSITNFTTKLEQG